MGDVPVRVEIRNSVLSLFTTRKTFIKYPVSCAEKWVGSSPSRFFRNTQQNPSLSVSIKWFDGLRS